MQKALVIVGTGGMGREAAAWVRDAMPDAMVHGFLDEAVDRHGQTVGDLPVLGGLEWLEGHGDVEVVVAMGVPAKRARMVGKLDALGARLATVVHPRAMVGPRVTVGEGSIVCPGVLLTCDIHLGRAVICNYGSMVGHDGDIGDYAFLAPGVHLAGNITIGERADVGTGAAVRPKIRIGARSVVGAGAVVVRDVDPDTTVVGVPARPLRRD